MRSILVALILAGVFTGCSNTVHPGKRTDVSFSDADGKHNLAITAESHVPEHAMFLLVENSGEQEVNIFASYFYFEDSNGKIIGGLGTEAQMRTHRGWVRHLPIGIGKKGTIALVLPEGTASVSYRTERQEFFEIVVE